MRSVLPFKFHIFTNVIPLKFVIMATIQFGAIVTDARGKLNGSQLSRNRAGALLQKKCAQRQGATQAQSLFRSQFSSLARYWRTLTEAEQLANNAAVSAYPYTDKYGNTRYFTGYQLLLRSNINRYVSGLAPISEVPATPPTGFALSDVAAIAIIFAPSSNSITIIWTAASPSPTDYLVQAFIGNQVSAGISNYTGAYLFAASIDAGDGELDLLQSGFPSFASWVAGNAVFVKLVVIHAPSGIEVGSYVSKSIIS